MNFLALLCVSLRKYDRKGEVWHINYEKKKGGGVQLMSAKEKCCIFGSKII